MVSAFSHAVSAVAIGALFPRASLPRSAWWLGAACAVAPDLDVLGHWSGVPYEHVCGHRGLTHSVPFALVAAAIIVGIAGRARRWADHRAVLWVYLSLCMASHGVLDALTDGGLGIAFLAPFSAERWFLPWRPIEVSPLSVRGFFSERGLAVMQSELLWVCVPSAVVYALGHLWHHRHGSSSQAHEPR